MMEGKLTQPHLKTTAGEYGRVVSVTHLKARYCAIMTPRNSSQKPEENAGSLDSPKPQLSTTWPEPLTCDG